MVQTPLFSSSRGWPSSKIMNVVWFMIVKIIELLWRQKWTSVDGMGALVITPTRELVST